MGNYDTRIPVTAEGRDIAREAKRDGETWDEYIRRCAEEPPEVTRVSEVDTATLIESLKDELSMTADPTVEVDTEQLLQRIDRLESAVKEATEAAQSADRKLEQLR